MLAGQWPAGHRARHAFANAPAPRMSTAQRAPQAHGKLSGQLSHSSPFFSPWPACWCPGCTVGLFHSAESPACGPVVSMLAAVVTVTLQGLLWYQDLSRARNWVLSSLGDDCPEQGHCLQGLALTLWIQNPLLEATLTES